MTPTASTQPQCVNIRNRANAQHSTGPRSESGKQRSARNALTHGLTARTAVLPSEDPAAFEQHRLAPQPRPAPRSRRPLPRSPQSRIPSPGRRGACDARSADQLRELQLDRLERQRKDLRDAASVFQFHKHKGLPYDPAEDGFVFSKTEVEAFAQRAKRLNEAWKVENFTLLGFRTPRNAGVFCPVDALC